MQRISLVNTAHNLIKEVLHAGAIAIDATVGNGHDTLFLVEQVSPSGKVFGFDIQAAAIESTHQKCLQTPNPECLTLIHASHAEMADRIPTHHHGTIIDFQINNFDLNGYHPFKGCYPYGLQTSCNGNLISERL